MTEPMTREELLEYANSDGPVILMRRLAATIAALAEPKGEAPTPIGIDAAVEASLKRAACTAFEQCSDVDYLFSALAYQYDRGYRNGKTEGDRLCARCGGDVLIVDVVAIQAERDAAVARAEKAEARVRELEQEAAEELACQKEDIEKHRANSKSTDEFLRRVLGPMWNALWGQPLEELGGFIDRQKAIVATLTAERDRLRADRDAALKRIEDLEDGRRADEETAKRLLAVEAETQAGLVERVKQTFDYEDLCLERDRLAAEVEHWKKHAREVDSTENVLRAERDAADHAHELCDKKLMETEKRCAELEAALADAMEYSGCDVQLTSSRACERGTKGCVTRHDLSRFGKERFDDGWRAAIEKAVALFDGWQDSEDTTDEFRRRISSLTPPTDGGEAVQGLDAAPPLESAELSRLRAFVTDIRSVHKRWKDAGPEMIHYQRALSSIVSILYSLDSSPSAGGSSETQARVDHERSERIQAR